MIKEELKKEAEEWLNKWEFCNKCENKVNCIGNFSYCKKVVLQSYLASAEPREKQIQIDAEQIRALQKQNGELTDKVKELEKNIETLTKVINNVHVVRIKQLTKENGELTDELKTLRESIKDYGAGCYENGLKNGKRKLEEQIEKMKCLNEEIIRALNECLDYEWLHAHNGKAKYLYLQTVIDIVNEKFKEIKE